MGHATESLIDVGAYVQLFRGREDFFAQQGEDHYRPVHKRFDEGLVRAHLRGDVTCGLYVLSKESLCHLICIDIDIPKADLGCVDLLEPGAKHAYLKDNLDAVLSALRADRVGIPTEAILLEDTGGRGYHVWAFFSDPISGEKAVSFGKAVKSCLDFEIEFFPKQGRLHDGCKYGNLIKLPLGIHRKYKAQSAFLIPVSGGFQKIDGLEANLQHLKSVVPASPAVIDEALAHFPDTTPDQDTSRRFRRDDDQTRPLFLGNPEKLIADCAALGAMRSKAEAHTPLSHSETFHFANVMLSVQDGAETVRDTLRRSLAASYSRQQTDAEIERLLPLHPTLCSTLVDQGLCSEYCTPRIARRNEDPLVPNTSPCSAWLRKAPDAGAMPVQDMLEAIGEAGNVRRAFFQLREYHEHEDALFFDPFDFEHFESSLDANCDTIALGLREKTRMPFHGYMPVSLPKKLDEDRNLVSRVMSYSTVYDQVPIQSIFNIVAPIIEGRFQETSFGYRWNRDSSTPYRVFEDWTKVYPRYRSGVVAALERSPKGFYVCCDIKGYYDHVKHDILLEQLRHVRLDDCVYHTITTAVRAYEAAPDTERGLPQGPAYARLLANLYLNAFDVFAAETATAYFRYVDDLVFVFENEADAHDGLDLIVRQLTDLGLELSQDEAKRAAVVPNTDLSRVRKTLDRIHYGMLEGARHVDNLPQQAAADFMAAVKRHSISPVTIDQLIEMNEFLPTLLYVVTREALLPHPHRQEVVVIVEFLIERRLFFPKRLKKIFYRLVELVGNEDRLLALFDAMHETHRAYLMLSVFGAWQSRGEHRALLEKLVRRGMEDDCVYTRGFATAVAPRIGIDLASATDLDSLDLGRDSNRFLLEKWLGATKYLDLSEESRRAIRNAVGLSCPDLIKVLVLAGMERLPTTHADGVYLRGLLEQSDILTLPVACSFLAAATDGGEVFDALVETISRRPAFQSLAMSFLSKSIFERRKSAGLAELENLRGLYESGVKDDAVKHCMREALSRFTGQDVDDLGEFLRSHKEIARHNECLLFSSVDSSVGYDYLELLPEDAVLRQTSRTTDEFQEAMQELVSRKVVLPSNVSYDGTRRQISIRSTAAGMYAPLTPGNYSLPDGSIVTACRVAEEAYRKALYYRRQIGRAPLITPDNLFIDQASGTISFLAVGRSLCATHVVQNTRVGNEKTDIARMVGEFLRTLVFKTPERCDEFLKEKTHTGLEAFLALFLRNLRNPKPDRRYSSSRFSYLVGKLEQAETMASIPGHVEATYLCERLKAALFRSDAGNRTWYAASQALSEHLGAHVREVWDSAALRSLPFRHRLWQPGGAKRHLSVVGQNLMGLALAREDLQPLESRCAPYFDLLEMLLLYSVIAIEFRALSQALQSSTDLEALKSSSLLTDAIVRVEAGSYETTVNGRDLAALVIRQAPDERDEGAVGTSLTQTALQVLLACPVEVDSGLTIGKRRGIRKRVFEALAHSSLVRVPEVESIVEGNLQKVLSALASGEDIERAEGLSRLRDAVSVVGEDLKRIRKGLGIGRLHGKADGSKRFPPHVNCTASFRLPQMAHKSVILDCGLTNTFPSGRNLRASWDRRDRSIVNLLIPCDGLNDLIHDLKTEKVFGFRLSYLYSGKAKLFLDLPITCALALAYGLGDLVKGDPSAAYAIRLMSSPVALLIGVPLVAMAVRIVVHDLGYWFPMIQRLKGVFRRSGPPDKKRARLRQNASNGE